MAWIEITEADLLTVLSGPELASCRSAALASGQADPVAPTIAQVVAMARGHVAACRMNALGAGNTLPEKLKAPALDVIAYRLPSRLNLKAGPSRQELHNHAMRLFELISQGRFDIEEPASLSSESNGENSPRITERVRHPGCW